MKKTLLFILILSLSLFSVKVKADVVADYTLDMKINEDLSASIDIDVNLQNDSNSELISAYTIDLPFEVTNVDGNLDGNNVSIILNYESGISNIKVDFLTNFIKPDQKANLKLNIFTLNAVKQIHSTKQLYLPYPSSNYNYAFIKANITYPVLFGSITYSSEYKYNLDRVNDSFYRISFDQSTPELFLWGNPEFSLKFNTTVANRKDSVNHALFNLIPEYSNQSVVYSQIFNADYVLIDKLNNNFAFLTLNPNATADLSSTANIRLSSSETDLTTTEKYNWSLNLDSVLGQKIYSQINQGPDSTAKLKSLNEFLLKEFSVDTNKIQLTNLNDVWNNNKKSINSLQYCYLMVSTAEYLGLNSKVEYGYNILRDTKTLNPSIWCNVNVDGKSINFDFDYQKEIGYSQVSSSSVDRVKMGIWYPNQTYNGMLGLLTDNPVTAQIDTGIEVSNIEALPELSTDFPKNVFSGEFYSGIININNSSGKILKFNDLKINNESVMQSLQVGDLQKAIMPLQKNSIKIEYLRETDFVLNLSRQINVDAELNNNKLSNTIEVRFEPDYKLLGLFILISIVTLSIFIYLVFKIIRRKL